MWFSVAQDPSYPRRWRIERREYGQPTDEGDIEVFACTFVPYYCGRRAAEAARDLASVTATKAHHQTLMLLAPERIADYHMTLAEFAAYTARL